MSREKKRRRNNKKTIHVSVPSLFFFILSTWTVGGTVSGTGTWGSLLSVVMSSIPVTLAEPPFVLPPDGTPRRGTHLGFGLDSSSSFNARDGGMGGMGKGGSSGGAVSGGSGGQGVEGETKKGAKRNSSKSAATSSSSSGSSTATSAPSGSQPLAATPMIKVCYQGEPGAYSEKSLRELLGPNVIAVARPNFESCFRAVASRECDYACLPVENSLGGSIHENYDLMLRYDLVVVAEHECRVSHYLHAVHGVKREDIQYCMSHPQALAQVDNYLRGLGITPVPMYDTAGSAKLLADHAAGGTTPERALPDKCTAANTAAVASDLAGITYGLNCLDSNIEDDDTNFTRFLLLGRSGVSHHLTKKIPSKTSIVFTLPDSPGALYKALACFSLRDIDCSKIESRPTSASLLNYLKFKSRAQGHHNRNTAAMPRFRYCFYLDFLASELDESAQNALHHLNEQAEFCRILGSYPQKSRLVGPIHDSLQEFNQLGVVSSRDETTLLKLPSDVDDDTKMNVGIIGYGAFGQFLGEKFTHTHNVRCIDPVDKSNLVEGTNIEYFPMFEMRNFLKDLDVVVLAVPLVDFESIVTALPADLLNGKLVVEVCPLSVHPKTVLLQSMGPDVDIICSNPMFGPKGENSSWDMQPMVYEKVRIADERRADRFLHIFEKERCQMVQMTAEQQDAHTADAEFITHLTGRLLGGKLLPPTPVASKEYAALCDVADMTTDETFDLFYGMFKFNSRASEHLSKIRENLAKVERKIAAKDAYVAASAELRTSDRQRLVAECKQLLEEVVKSGFGDLGKEKGVTASAPAPAPALSGIIENFSDGSGERKEP